MLKVRVVYQEQDKPHRPLYGYFGDCLISTSVDQDDDSFTITFIDHNKLDDIIMSSSRKPDRLILRFGSKDVESNQVFDHKDYMKKNLTVNEKFIGKPYLTNLDAVGLEVDTACRFVSIIEIKGVCSNSDAIKRKALNEKNKNRVWNDPSSSLNAGEFSRR